MNEHVSARCPLDKTKTLLVIEPLDLSHFLAHYSDSLITALEDLNVAHYTKTVRTVKFVDPPKCSVGLDLHERL